MAAETAPEEYDEGRGMSYLLRSLGLSFPLPPFPSLSRQQR